MILRVMKINFFVIGRSMYAVSIQNHGRRCSLYFLDKTSEDARSEID